MPSRAEDKQKTLEEDLAAAAAEDGSSFIPDLLRRGLTLGFTGLFMGEEAVRRVFGDKVPREWIEFVISQSDRTRSELLDRLGREFGRVLSALDPAEVLRRLLEGQSVEIRIRFSEGERSGQAGVTVKSEAAEEPADPEPE